MTGSYRSITADRVKPGDKIPELRVPVTATTIVQGAVASRDWQPQHHDSAWAKRVGTRDIFMNTPTQGGWISKYITDWAGPTARVARMKYRMKASIYPGDPMVLKGTVTRVYKDSAGYPWIDLVIEVTQSDALCTSAAVTIAVPEKAGAENPWKRKADRWLVAELPPFAEAS